MCFCYCVENFDLDDSGNLRSSSPLIVKGSGQKFAVLQQSLQGKELHELLAESDKALCIVKDMFGDDPKVSSTSVCNLARRTCSLCY